jgi:hypothetical protein
MSNCEYVCDFTNCNKYLKEPVTLPCGDMICKEHVDSEASYFKCPICGDEFEVPENGFRINKKVNELLMKNSHLGGLHKQIKDAFDIMEKAIEDFQKSNLAHPDLFIWDYFSTIRNEIDSHRQHMIESIEKRSEEILNKLIELEHECYKKQSKLEKLSFKKEEMVEMSERLRQSVLDDQELVTLGDKIRSSIDEIRQKSHSYQNVLLVNKTVSFVAKDCKWFGDLVIKENHVALQLTNESGKLVKTLEGHTGNVKCLEWLALETRADESENGDPNRLVSCSNDKTIKVWSTESGECLKTLTGHTNR